MSRGKALREERDERLQQMAKLQQDIANIPQEAVSEIVGERFALGEWRRGGFSDLTLLIILCPCSGDEPKSIFSADELVVGETRSEAGSVGE